MSQTSITPEAIIRTSQIITLAMVMGAVSFAFIALMTGALDEAPSGIVISLIGAFAAALQCGLAVVLPNLIANRSRPQNQPSGEMASYGTFVTQHIVRLALLEGAAFFNIVVTMIEHNWWSLGIAAVLVGWMLTQFPTRDRVERWIAAHGTQPD